MFSIFLYASARFDTALSFTLLHHKPGVKQVLLVVDQRFFCFIIYYALSRKFRNGLVGTGISLHCGGKSRVDICGTLGNQTKFE